MLTIRRPCDAKPTVKPIPVVGLVPQSAGTRGITGLRLPDMVMDAKDVILDCTIVDAAACEDREYGHLYHLQGITAAAPDDFSGASPGNTDLVLRIPLQD
jgi:hypothetical protein